MTTIKWIIENARDLVMLFALFLFLVTGGARAAKVLSYRKKDPGKATQASLEPLSRLELKQDSKGPSAWDQALLLTDSLNEKELIDRLGLPIATFKPSLVNIIAAVILSLLGVAIGVVGGVAILVFGRYAPGFSGTAAEAAWTFLLLALGLMATMGMVWGAIAGLIWVKRTLSRRVLVCPGGIIRIYRGKAVGCYWDQISEASVRSRYSPSSLGPGERVCTLRRDDGLMFEFDKDNVNNFRKLIKVISMYLPLNETVDPFV